MTIGDPFPVSAAVSGRTVALPLINRPVPYEAGDPALERFRRNWLVSGIGEAGQRAWQQLECSWWARAASAPPSSCI